MAREIWTSVSWYFTRSFVLMAVDRVWPGLRKSLTNFKSAFSITRR